jgi:orc1/cdc6 family replication initiation protein
MNNKSVIVDFEVLSEDFMPSYIHEREHHIKWLMSALFPSLRGRKPVNVWIYGHPGTGKSCISKFVLQKLKEKGGSVQGIYVNCWRYATLYSILDYIVKDYRLLGGESPSTSTKLDRFLRFVKESPFIVILDEIDVPPPKERNNILYNLSRMRTIGMICVSRDEETFHRLDDRVKSRLSARLLEFEAYTSDQIVAILRARAVQALRTDSWNEKILIQIAKLAQGDVRVALNILKSASEYAEAEGSPILREHVERGIKNSLDLQKEYILKRLTLHHRLIYNIIQEKPNILSGNLWTCYSNACKKTDQRPIARRTFSAYIQRLEGHNLISSDKPSLMGKVRTFKAA